MNYFEFYELPVSFKPDLNLVKVKFYALSKKFHPDFYANESEEKQQEVLDLSTLNNKAYQVLSNQKKTLQYVLALKGVVQAEESYQLPQSFLMDMMDVNEALMDLEFEPDAEKLQKVIADVNLIENELDAELAKLTTEFDEQSAESENSLKDIKDIFYRQKYIARIREKLPKS
ncbi:iron-sulfur cluster co-chaperone HscB C-terminal domain-containing protein [Pedobacter aquatilis]|uniref:iron-sulfur cluster co-chaperone HscB C-terminal domain-containing protein n=1 Tax=Pedobacter aquatilis TaxID=351343 RepID=UPI0025B281AA|nr:iron-sulfur cluster co-chaperone HscB C-terminal domain-containing protein [Pedobacter aquatilis]MDN3588453.1 iron-sulfur cluster co-chaperone HscB C-terminal domain-containing protein [Pedobacter aquatilis]